MPFVVKFKKVWPRKINADQPRNPRCWMVLLTILDDESDYPNLWYVSWAIWINSKTFQVSATGCIRTVYNPFDGILIWNQTRNLTSIREPPRLEFGEDEFSINFNIKDSFSFRHQFNITDLHFLQFCRDTLRIRKVVSHGTVDDFHFHDFTFIIGWIADYTLINRSP